MTQKNQRKSSSSRDKSASESRFARRFKLGLNLLRGRAIRVDDVAAEAGCSRRTVFRDLRILREVGGISTIYRKSGLVSVNLREDDLKLRSPLETISTDEHLTAISIALNVAPLLCLGVAEVTRHEAIAAVYELMGKHAQVQLDAVLQAVRPLVERASSVRSVRKNNLQSAITAVESGTPLFIKYTEGSQILSTVLLVDEIDLDADIWWVSGVSLDRSERLRFSTKSIVSARLATDSD